LPKPIPTWPKEEKRGIWWYWCREPSVDVWQW
jgi:hypothetical protein